MPPARLTSALALFLFVSLCAAQNYLAAGTYQLASPTSFRNGSAFFNGNPSLTVTEGLLDVAENGVDIIVQLRVAAGGSSGIFTVGGQVGLTSNGQILISIFDCVQNGGNFGYSLCAVAQQANGCSNSLNWGQGTTNAPFANRTLIVTDGLCGIIGTQLWQCGSAGACNAAPNALPALPVGEYNIYGQRPAFIFENPQGVIPSLVNSSLTVQNNYEHLLIFYFDASPATIAVKLAGAAVLDTGGQLLFSYSTCSQSNQGGPVAFQLCGLFDSEDGCEISTEGAQFDIHPPNNVTTILLGNSWCSFSGTFNYVCSGSCDGPINNGAAAALDIDAGNCLSFNGNTINFDSTSGGCVIPSLDVGALTVDTIDGTTAVFGTVIALNSFTENATIITLNVTNSNIQNQIVVNQEITNQTVVNQQIITQQVTNQTIVEQTVVQQTVINQNVTNIVIEQTGDVYDLTVTRYLFLSQSFAPTEPFYATASGTFNLIFCDINLLPADEFCSGTTPTATFHMEKIGRLVTGTLNFGANGQITRHSNGCDTACANNMAYYLATGPAQIPATMRPTSPVIGTTSQFMMRNKDDGPPEYNPFESGFCQLQLIVFTNGNIAWMPVRTINAVGDIEPCINSAAGCGYLNPSEGNQRESVLYGFKSADFYLGAAYDNSVTGTGAPKNPNGVQTFSFSYVLPVNS